MELVLTLLQQMSLFLVIAYLFTKSPVFKSLAGETLQTRHKFILYFVFTIFSILGTYLGLPIQDAIANTRAIGAVLAGLIGGPILGLSVGLTSGLHRFSLGGFTAFSCGVSTTVEGLIGGLIHLYLVRRSQSERIYSPQTAFVATFCAELLQMGIILLLSRPLTDAVSLVRVIALPMLLANSTGAAIFISIIRDQKRMYDKFGAIFSAKALRIAERALGLLAKGLNPQAAGELALIIHDETGVGAVAITDRKKILAFVGVGADHHKSGGVISSEFTRKAISTNQVVFADGVREHFYCAISKDCLLGSALVVPLHLDNEVIGTIKLYEPRQKLFLNLNRTLGEGIAKLLSHQLLLTRYEEQKNLLVKSELKLLQAQINPHFLFNSLNTVIAVIRKDASRGRDLLLHLSNFFRKNLKRSSDMATLAEELDHVNSYLKLEKARFEERLQVEQVIDSDLLNLKMPIFVLQPILENEHKAKCGHNLKYDVQVLRRAGIELRGIAADSMLLAYCLYPGKYPPKMDRVAEDYLGHHCIAYEDVAGKGAKQICFDQVPIEKALS
ncbi:MAG: histidine kinase, partial [Geopsychrobacter sp.]|nr:histidine kinase [Geopsychrobacter sp.]